MQLEMKRTLLAPLAGGFLALVAPLGHDREGAIEGRGR
jgi:hypothetical protein